MCWFLGLSLVYLLNICLVMNEDMAKKIRLQCLYNKLTEAETKWVLKESREYAAIGIAPPVGILIRQQLKQRK